MYRCLSDRSPGRSLPAQKERERMAHTTIINGSVFVHNGDFSGDVRIVNPSWGKVADHDEHGKPIYEATIPFEDIKGLVAAYVRDQRWGWVYTPSSTEGTEMSVSTHYSRLVRMRSHWAKTPSNHAPYRHLLHDPNNDEEMSGRELLAMAMDQLGIEDGEVFEITVTRLLRHRRDLDTETHHELVEPHIYKRIPGDSPSRAPR